MYGWRLRHDASDTDTDISGSGNMTDLHYFFPLSWLVQVWTLEPKHDPTFCRIHFPQQQQVAFVSEQGMFCRKMRTVWICPVSNLKLPEEKLLRNFTKKYCPWSEDPHLKLVLLAAKVGALLLPEVVWLDDVRSVDGIAKVVLEHLQVGVGNGCYMIRSLDVNVQLKTLIIYWGWNGVELKFWIGMQGWGV